jgi:hypothetical protein
MTQHVITAFRMKEMPQHNCFVGAAVLDSSAVRPKHLSRYNKYMPVIHNLVVEGKLNAIVQSAGVFSIYHLRDTLIIMINSRSSEAIVKAVNELGQAADDMQKKELRWRENEEIKLRAKNKPYKKQPAVKHPQMDPDEALEITYDVLYKRREVRVAELNAMAYAAKMAEVADEIVDPAPITVEAAPVPCVKPAVPAPITVEAAPVPCVKPAVPAATSPSWSGKRARRATNAAAHEAAQNKARREAVREAIKAAKDRATKERAAKSAAAEKRRASPTMRGAESGHRAQCSARARG